jgi:hypothetical protein
MSRGNQIDISATSSAKLNEKHPFPGNRGTAIATAGIAMMSETQRAINHAAMIVLAQGGALTRLFGQHIVP